VKTAINQEEHIMSNKRLHAKGEYPIFDKEYERLYKKSEILSGAELTMNNNLVDKAGLWALKNRLTGGDDGRYKDSWGDTYTATIPALQKEIAVLEEDAQVYQDRRAAQGYRANSEWPPDLLEKRLKLEARLSISFCELDIVEKRMAAIQEKEEEQADDKALQFGLKGSGRPRDGKLVEMDGCKVIQINGRYILATGAYRGMDLPSYRDLMQSWQTQQRLDAKEKLHKLQAKCEANGLPVPRQLPFKSNRKVDPRSLPAWPEGVRDWLRQPETVDVPLVRRKTGKVEEGAE
jgi:hypothetical protein